MDLEFKQIELIRVIIIEANQDPKKVHFKIWRIIVWYAHVQIATTFIKWLNSTSYIMITSRMLISS